MCEIMDLQLLSFVFLVMDKVTFLSNLKSHFVFWDVVILTIYYILGFKAI